jgi:surface antigen
VVAASAGPNRFPWGYCTWWVAHKRYIPWRGNAWQWYGNAIAYGRPVGKTPVVGAVMVTWESRIGHVAYVESVNGNTFTVSEMNYRGYGIQSTRTITTSSVPLIGFIY